MKKLVESGEIEKDEKTVIYITGNGLKTQDVLMDHLAQPPTIRADLKTFDEFYRKNKKTEEVKIWH